MRGLILLLIAVLLGAFGQIALKSGIEDAKRVHHLFAEGRGLALFDVFRSLLVPEILLGLLLYAVSAGFWITVLSVWRLSYAYPLISVGYILVAVLSWWLLGEPIPLVRWAGILVICLGVALVGLSGTEKPPGSRPSPTPPAGLQAEK
jgi:multidrug transporter EmrE-like cation transporter